MVDSEATCGTATVTEEGGELMLTLPPAFCLRHGLGEGSTVDMRVENGVLVIRPSRASPSNETPS